MPITQDRLIGIVRCAQELAEGIMHLQKHAKYLGAEEAMIGLNALHARTQDPVAANIIANGCVVLSALYNAIKELPLSNAALQALAAEDAHYKVRAKENMRQAAYQRRKRQELGKGSGLQQPLASQLQTPPSISQELQDYLDGKTNTLPPSPAQTSVAPPSWAPTVPHMPFAPATPAPQPSWKPSWTPAAETNSERVPDAKANAEAPNGPSSERAPDTSMLVPSKLPDGPREAPLAFDTRGKDVL